MRPSGRKTDQMRKVTFERGVSKHAEGSCLVKFGDTHVLCTASLEDKTPPWLRNSGKGWVTAEYGMLPRATGDRMKREAASGKQGGRTLEIQRLIGRSLRAVVDLEAQLPGQAIPEVVHIVAIRTSDQRTQPGRQRGRLAALPHYPKNRTTSGTIAACASSST